MDCDIVPALPHMISPGAYLLPQWLSLIQQQWIVKECRKWANGPVPFHRNSIYGKKMSVQSLSLGWHWSPYKYSRNAINVNGKKVLDVPEWILSVYRHALAAIDDYSDFTDHASHLSSADKTTNKDAYIPDAVLFVLNGSEFFKVFVGKFISY